MVKVPDTPQIDAQCAHGANFRKILYTKRNMALRKVKRALSYLKCHDESFKILRKTLNCKLFELFESIKNFFFQYDFLI